KQTQPESEPDAGPLEIEPVESELARAIDVARCVDLRDPGETRTYAVARVIAGNFLQPDELAVAAHLDLTRTQRSRADEAHVAGEDVPQLRQLVHRGGAHQAADAGHARIVFARLNRTGQRLGVWHHRSELQ